MLSLPGLLDESQLTGMARAGEEKSNSLVSKERRPKGYAHLIKLVRVKEVC